MDHQVWKPEPWKPEHPSRKRGNRRFPHLTSLAHASGYLLRPLQKTKKNRKRGTAIPAPYIPRSRVGLPFTTTSKNKEERKVMDHQEWKPEA